MKISRLTVFCFESFQNSLHKLSFLWGFVLTLPVLASVVGWRTVCPQEVSPECRQRPIQQPQSRQSRRTGPDDLGWTPTERRPEVFRLNYRQRWALFEYYWAEAKLNKENET